MKHFFIFFLTVSLYCQSGLWQPGTAHTLPEGRWEIGLFQPVRWGQSESREFLFYKLTSLFMPNVTIKQRWSKPETLVLSTVHTILYPTPLLKTLQSPLGKEVGGPNMFALISPEFKIPSMIIPLTNSIQNHQFYNAKFLSDSKAAYLIDEYNFNLKNNQKIFLSLIFDENQISVIRDKLEQIVLPNANKIMLSYIKK